MNTQFISSHFDTIKALLARAADSNLSSVERYQALTDLLPYGVELEATHCDTLGYILFDPFLWRGSRCSFGSFATVEGLDRVYQQRSEEQVVKSTWQPKSQIRSSCARVSSTGERTCPEPGFAEDSFPIESIAFECSIEKVAPAVQIVKLLYAVQNSSAIARAEYWILKVFEPNTHYFHRSSDGGKSVSFNTPRLDNQLCLTIGATCINKPFALSVYKFLCHSGNISEVLTALKGLAALAQKNRDWNYLLPILCVLTNSRHDWRIGAAEILSGVMPPHNPSWVLEAGLLAQRLIELTKLIDKDRLTQLLKKPSPLGDGYHEMRVAKFRREFDELIAKVDPRNIDPEILLEFTEQATTN